jgi:NAD(P)-dependent dehydrogenase (short-subunit alcohol dehydrogenase family)
MGNSLKGKTAIVTGAGSGVGRAYALALAAEGARVIVNDTAIANAAKVADEIATAGGMAQANSDNVADFQASARIAEQALGAFGSIDILIANAGIIRPGNIHEMEADDWSQVLAVHANGTFNCYRHVVPHMIRQGGGSIITTGAKPIDTYFPGLAAYRAAKAAILVLTLNASRELKEHNINVNSIMPGATATPMQQTFMASLVEKGINVAQEWPVAAPPETVPPLGVFLCSDACRHITGLSFYLRGTTVSVATSFGDLASTSPADENWKQSELAEMLPGLVAQAQPRQG